jgi:benzoate-CoA ligase family protein
MRDNTVSVDRSVVPNRLDFAPVFNVAVPFIDRHAWEGRGDKVAVRTEAGDVTYGQIARRTARFGNVLLGASVAPGERVLMVVKDGPDFIALFFGAIKAGIVPVAVNTMMRGPDYAFLIDDSEAAAVVYSPEYAEAVEAGLAAAAHAPRLVLKTEGSGGLVERSAAEPSTLEPAKTTHMDDCFWLYSSGSTGNPKGVVHPHRSMVCTSERYARNTAGLREDDTVFSVSKLFHSYGFGNAMTFPLWVGATIVLSDRRVSPAMAFETIETFRPTVFFGVPTLYAQQLRAMDEIKPDLSSLRLCISAGEALPGDVVRRWHAATGTLILDGLGSTENLHIFISNREDDYRYGASGKPVSGYEVKLVDEDGVELTEPEAMGTVWVKGESAAKYYWKNPEKTAATMRGEWLNTGDMYYRTADGWYVNAGRGDDMLKVGGLWCSPFEIEGRLIEHPSVLEAAVVGRADDDGLTKPEAWIVLNNAADACPALEAELVEHCKAGLAHYKYPRWFRFVDDLPKTVTGKIQRFRLRE